MIHYQYDYSSVAGRQKMNQDGLAVIEGKYKRHPFWIGMVADGVGGLNHGEVASAFVIRRLIQYIEGDFYLNCLNLLQLQSALQKEIQKINEELIAKGTQEKFSMATTLILLICFDSNYLACSIGDSRIYYNGTQMTKDQVNEQGLLRQAIGITPVLDIPFWAGKIKKKDTFVMASDGFYRKADFSMLHIPFKNCLSDLLQNNLKLGEKDNMSGIVIQWT